MRDVDEAFGRFVAAERPALLAEALRLTGDAPRAEEAVQAALARVHRRWGRTDPRAAAGAALASAAGRLGRGEQVLESLDAAPPPPPATWRLDTAAAGPPPRAPPPPVPPQRAPRAPPRLGGP
ncbi:sigma factor, partial [Geodermatophilus sp. SYSU D00708]